jgi:hypothetical protein
MLLLCSQLLQVQISSESPEIENRIEIFAFVIVK